MPELSRYISLMGALPFVVLGIAHAFATPRTPAQSKGLSPRDPVLRHERDRVGHRGRGGRDEEVIDARYLGRGRRVVTQESHGQARDAAVRDADLDDATVHHGAPYFVATILSQSSPYCCL